MITETNITIYAYMGGAYNRYYIRDEKNPGVHWEGRKQSNINKAGLSTADEISIYIPAKNIPSDIAITTGKDIVIKGIVNDVIDTTSEASVCASIKALKAKYYVDYPKSDYPISDFPKITHNPRIVTIIEAEPMLYGSPNMQYYKLVCK